MRYAIVIEQAANNYSAYVPDLPGCGAHLAAHHPGSRGTIPRGYNLPSGRPSRKTVRLGPPPLSQVEHVDIAA